MCIKVMYNITTFKNVSQYQMANSTMQNRNYFCTRLIQSQVRVFHVIEANVNLVTLRPSAYSQRSQEV